MDITPKTMKNLFADICTNVVENFYDGDESRYIVWQISDQRAYFSCEDEVRYEEISLMIHYYVARDYNYILDKKNIKKILKDNDFSYPIIQQFYDYESGLNHIVFETSIINYVNEN